MSQFTREQMEELLALHEKAEFELDLDATLETLVDNPVYELPALGWHIEGKDAVRETYERLLRGGDERNMWADKRVHAISENSLSREAYVYIDTADGKRVTGQYFVVMEFEGDKIAGERMYMDTTFAQVMEEILGPDFGEVPGVSRLADVVPPPVPRLDRAAAHAANSNH
ncbi:nuclear transport factor 2 family protein [Nocardia africana]|uniref:RNA polymerase factor sigma-70 n=1 Tax=Nocardia africana TaxID=134964 RepID=A0A378X0Y2_9NOCA|nr:nuclear transport factor 2 family protein [Nocardia africana]MCC3312356.1 nuclear transport factor 2 family protein [Nocardia africana]SUA46334.1 RNA polymerase factor sigma-70 [Nocardia africana]